MAVICARSASLTNGQLMIKDMWPSRSLANPVIDPAPQGPRYVRVVENATPVVVGNSVYREVSGLTAYFLVNQDNAGNALDVAEAQAISSYLINRVRNGLSLELATINAGIVALPGLGGATIEGAGSTTLLSEVLTLLAGAKYTVPAGHTFKTALGAIVANTNNYFVESAYSAVNDEDSSFWISLAQGDLSGAKSASLVVVYDNDGVVI